MSKVLLIGVESVGQEQILARLLGRQNQKQDQKQSAPAAEDQTNWHELVLSTKYYDAKLEIHRHTIAHNALVRSLACEIEDFEAIIAVMDSENLDSFRQIVGFVERALASHEFDVCLMLATNSSQDAPRQEPGDAELWCQEHGFEFISIVNASHESTTRRTENAHQLRHSWTEEEQEGKQGMERVQEALQCNMWHSMQLKTKTNQEAAKTEQTAAVSSTVNATPPKRENAICDGNQEPAKDKRLEEALQSLEIAELGEDRALSTATSNEPDREREDVDLEEFSAMIAEVRRIRESGQNLSQEERRQQAERMAIRLWNFLGSDDDDDDGDSD